MQTGPPASPIQLKPGESISFSLKGRGSAGYTWTHDIERGSEVITVKTERSPRPPMPPAGAPPPSSFSLDTIFTITANTPGNAEVKLALARSTAAPLEEHRVTVTVT